MFETYRMLGREHEAHLLRAAEGVGRSADARRLSAAPKRSFSLRAVLVAVSPFRSRRDSDAIRSRTQATVAASDSIVEGVRASPYE